MDVCRAAFGLCLAAVLFLVLPTIAWGQDAADPSVSTLTRELKQGDSFVRWRAAKALLRIGSYSKAEAPAMAEALKIEEGDISERAREALVKIGPDSVPALVRVLKDRDSPAHSKAIEVLAAIGPPAVPGLIEALKDGDEEARLGALEALREINLQAVNPRPTTLLPILISALRDPNPAIRGAAAQAVARMGAEAGPAYPALIEALKDPDPDVRWKSASPLACDAGLALLLEALRNQDGNVRSAAASALSCIAPNRRPALDALIKAAKDSDAKVRASVVGSLDTAGMIERGDAAVIAVWLEALRDSDRNVRRVAAGALGSVRTKAAVAALIEALQDREASVRRSVADSLARRDAAEAVPGLIQLLSDQDKEVRNAASRALVAIGQGAAQAVVVALRNQDGNIRSGAALILGKLGLNPECLAALSEALKDQDASVRRSAALSIGTFAQGPDATTVIPALIDALENPDESVRSRAARALSGVRPEGPEYDVFGRPLPKPLIPIPSLPKSVIPILIGALKDQDPAVRRQAAEALAGIGPVAKAAAPALFESLTDRNPDVCRYATYALRNIGVKPPAIIPALNRLLKHPDRRIRDVAVEALTNIGAPAVPSLVRLLMGQDSALRVKSYYALVSTGDVFALIATLKRRNKELRSLVIEALDEMREGSLTNAPGPNPLIDPSRKYVFTRVGTGCGYENEGRTMFVSLVDSGKSFPILATCVYLNDPRVLEYAGKYYLLIVGQNGGTAEGTSFWLYDMKANRYVIHAEGEIDDTKERGVFSYAYYQGCSPTPVGTVTMKNLINRETPLRLLPRPMHGLTLRRNVRMFHTLEECSQPDTKPFEIIRNAGTRVLVVSKCEDGSYAIYYKGAIASVPRGTLKRVR